MILSMNGDVAINWDSDAIMVKSGGYDKGEFVAFGEHDINQ